MYNHAYGLYADTWSAWTELAINFAITVIAGYLWGIAGILLGKIISTGIIIVIWKPYYLFRSGLYLPYKYYWFGAIRYYFISIISIGITHSIIINISLNEYTYFSSLILYCILGTVIFLLINIPLIMVFCKGAKDCLRRLKKTK